MPVAGLLDRLSGLSLGDRMQAAMIETPVDAIQFVKRQWPELWQRLVVAARDAHMRPGTALIRAIEAGLPVIEGDA